MKATVIEEKCIGCGACAVVANGVFTMNDTGYAIASGNVTEENINEVVEASENCPTDAIEVEK